MLFLRRHLFKCSVIQSWVATAGGRFGFLSSLWQTWLLKLCETTGSRIIWTKAPSGVFLLFLLFSFCTAGCIWIFLVWYLDPKVWKGKALSWKNKQCIYPWYKLCSNDATVSLYHLKRNKHSYKIWAKCINCNMKRYS